MDRYQEIASAFSKKYEEHVKGQPLLEEVNQNFWHSLILSHNRCRKLGLERDIRIIENAPFLIKGREITKKADSMQDAGRRTTLVSSPVSIRRRYFKNGKKIAEKIDYTAEANCMIAEASDGAAVKREVVCPACGAIGTRESLYDGCDYCQHKFQVGDDEKKVSSFSLFHDNLTSIQKEMKSNTIMLAVSVALLVICIGIVTQSFILKDTLYLSIALSKIAGVLAVVVFANCLFLGLARWWAIKNSGARLEATPALREVEANCQGFHFAKFAEELEYKLKAIHFAESQKDIESFAGQLVVNQLDYYKEVVDCQMKTCRIVGYGQDEKMHNIHAKVVLVLTLLHKNRIHEKEETVNVTLHKSRNAKASRSLVSYSCEHCGNSVNLLNVGNCEYCGTRLNMEEYDWVMHSYQHNSWKRKDGFRFYRRLAMVAVTAIVIAINWKALYIAGVAAQRGIEEPNGSVYVYEDEMIPSLENYGYAFYQDGSRHFWKGAEYYYSYVDEKGHVLFDYPKHLVEEHGFTQIKNDEDKIVLKKEREFSFGEIYVYVRVAEDKGYVITIGDVE